MPNINNMLKNNYHILINILLILSIYIGFFYDENITLGPKLDFDHALKQVASFKENFTYTFLNYDKIENSTRISPIFTSTIYFIEELTNDTDLTRFILLNIILLNQIFFYKCLKLSPLKSNFENKSLLLISASIYLSPSFRANSIWPESAMLGLLFFIISLYFFLKFTKNQNIKYALLNIFFLALASYIRPSFCVFVIYFTYKFLLHYYNNEKFFKNFLLIIFLNIILSLPAVYYVFILKVFFIEYGGLSSNYFNKISIISTIIFFHFIPFFYLFYLNLKFRIKNDFKFLLLVLISSYLIIQNFDYDLNLAGGGIVLHASNFILNNNLIFYSFYIISAFFLLKVIFLDKVNNFLIFLILMLITPQYHIFHKYYDPLVIILILTIINFQKIPKLYKEINFILILYGFYISLNLLHLINNYLTYNA